MLFRDGRRLAVVHRDPAQGELSGTRPVGGLVKHGHRVLRGVEPASVLGERVIDDKLRLALVVTGERQLFFGSRAIGICRFDVVNEAYSQNP